MAKLSKRNFSLIKLVRGISLCAALSADEVALAHLPDEQVQARNLEHETRIRIAMRRMQAIILDSLPTSSAAASCARFDLV